MNELLDIEKLQNSDSVEVSLRTLRANLNYFRQELGPEYVDLFFNKLVLILDTSIVLSDLRGFLLSRRATDLQLCLRFQIVSLVAPRTLEDELLKHLPRLAEKTCTPVDEWQRAWADLYKPNIVFLEKVPEEASELVRILRDPNDEPFVRAYEIIKADGVLTNDLDIRALSITPQSGAQFVMDLRCYAEHKSAQLQIIVCGLPFVMIGIESAIGIVKLMVATIKRYPWIGLVALAGVSYFAFTPDGRGKLNEYRAKLSDILRKISEMPEVKLVQEKLANAYFSEQQLSKALPPRRVPVVLRDYVRRALAEESNPLSLNELSEKVQTLGYKASSVLSKAYLRRVLGALPESCCDEYGRWAIGKKLI